MPGLYEIVSRKILPYTNLFSVIFLLVVFSVAGYYIYTHYIYKKYSINDKIFGIDQKMDESKSNKLFGKDGKGAKKMTENDNAILTVVSLFSGFAIIYGLYYFFNGSSVSTAGPSGATASSGILKSIRGSSNNSNSMAMYLLAIGVFLLSYVMYYYFYTPKYTNPVKKDKVAKTGSAITVHFFTADWCPHCRKAKPEIDEFEKEYSNKKINGRTILINRVDCTDSEAEEVSKQISDFNVTSFPTVKIKDSNGNIFDFDAKLTFDNLKEFVNSVANN
jgi:thiol-disulfide isomerase/thioredoxin